MNERTKTLSEAARRLPPHELEALLDDLLEALHAADPGWDTAWTEEAARRMGAYEAGEMQASPASEVLARLGKR
jgi:hypothetical protein